MYRDYIVSWGTLQFPPLDHMQQIKFFLDWDI